MPRWEPARPGVAPRPRGLRGRTRPARARRSKTRDPMVPRAARQGVGAHDGWLGRYGRSGRPRDVALPGACRGQDGRGAGGPQHGWRRLQLRGRCRGAPAPGPRGRSRGLLGGGGKPVGRRLRRQRGGRPCPGRQCARGRAGAARGVWLAAVARGPRRDRPGGGPARAAPGASPRAVADARDDGRGWGPRRGRGGYHRRRLGHAGLGGGPRPLVRQPLLLPRSPAVERPRAPGGAGRCGGRGRGGPEHRGR